MNYIIHFCIFIVVLITYLHIQSHFQHASESDVFELDGIIDNRIDDVLDLKQPVVFRLEFIPTTLEDINIHALSHTNADTNVYVVDPTNGVRVTSSISSFKKIQDSTSSIPYYSDGNEEIIQRLSNDIRLRIASHYVHLVPPLLCTTRYDLIFGTDKCITRLQRNVAHRSYFTVTNGTVVVKLIHPDQLTNVNFDCTPGLVPDMWCSVAKLETTKISMKDVSLNKGQTLFVPPYWGIIFHMTKDSFMLSVKYSTYMSEMATSLHTCRFWSHKLFSRSSIVPELHKATNIHSTSDNISSIGGDVETPEPEEDIKVLSMTDDACMNNVTSDDNHNDK